MSQMDVEAHEQQAHAAAQENGYGGSHWVELGGFHPNPYQHPPQHHPQEHQDYDGFHLMPGPGPSSAGPSEPTYHQQMAPPVHPAHQQHHQPLRPLITPPWPSMLTSQSTYPPPILPTIPSPATAAAAAAPIVTPTSASSAPSTSSPRRTLTDADRRRMCLYHEENPTVKQTEIGAMFGVERSTVSKVLRQKEKYLFPDDGSRSPIKRSKGRFPDIERALSNWARNTQKSGTPVTDAMIREKARFFATTVGSSDSHTKITSSSWLEKFKQKNHLGGVKSRKNSEVKTDSDAGGDGSSAAGTPGVSPSSPNPNASGVASPSPLSASKSQDNLKNGSPDGFGDFPNYRLTASQSNTSLSSVFTDGAPSSFSAGPASPTSPFFSSDQGCQPSPFIPSQHARLPPLGAANHAYSRQRSQSFPLQSLDGPYMSTPPSSEPLTPKYLGHAAMDPPLSDDIPGNPLSIDATIAPLGHLHHQQHQQQQQQQQSLQGSSPSDLHAASPSPDDARRALEVVMAFFQRQPTGLVDPSEYITIGKLMEKLKLNGAQAAPPVGLHRIQEEPGGLGARSHSAGRSGPGDHRGRVASSEVHVGAGV